MQSKHQSSNTIKRVGTGVVEYSTTKESSGRSRMHSKHTNSLTRDDPGILVKQHQQGYGLWAQPEKPKQINRDPAPEELEQKLKPTNHDPNADITNDFDKRIIEKLKFQLKDATRKLEVTLVKLKEAEFNSKRTEVSKNTVFQSAERQDKEMTELQEKNEHLNNTILSLNEAFSSARKEISRLQTDLGVETEKSNNYYEMYQNLLLDKERRESNMSADLHKLNYQNTNLLQEKEQLVKMLRTQNSNTDSANNYHKIIEENNNTIKLHETQVTRLQYEVIELKKKLTQEENFKNKLNESVKKKNELINVLKEEVSKYKSTLGDYGNEVKWNQDIVTQKDQHLKVTKDKIKKLEEENKKYQKEIEKLKNKLKSGVPKEEYVPEEQVIEVQSKPYLFGPEGGEEEDF